MQPLEFTKFESLCNFKLHINIPVMFFKIEFIGGVLPLEFYVCHYCCKWKIRQDGLSFRSTLRSVKLSKGYNFSAGVNSVLHE